MTTMLFSIQIEPHLQIKVYVIMLQDWILFLLKVSGIQSEISPLDHKFFCYKKNKKITEPVATPLGFSVCNHGPSFLYNWPLHTVKKTW